MLRSHYSYLGKRYGNKAEREVGQVMFKGK